MPPPANRRMPLSCEPCRERKIRCPRNPNGLKGPCKTCIRRGIPPSSCVFLKDVNPRVLHRQREKEVASNEELMRRIGSLEGLIRRHIQTADSSQHKESLGAADNDLALHHASMDASNARIPQTSSQGLAYISLAQSSMKTTNPPRGKLLRSSSGHERYEPRSSQFSSVLELNSRTSTVTADLDKFKHGSEFPLATSTSTYTDLLSVLPPVSQCDELVEVYFNAFAPLFHILHNPTFRADYANFRSNPTSLSLSWLSVLFAVLSVAVTALDSQSPLLQDLGREGTAMANIASLTERYRSAVLNCLEADHYLWRQNLYTLQSLIITIYGINHSHGQSWALLGLTRNIALSLGCHVDPDNFGLDLVVSEERRRCWAGLNMLYMIQNTALGNIDPTHTTSDVRLPLDLDDDVLTSIDSNLLGNNSSPSQMSYLLFKFRLYDICSRICQQMFSRAEPSAYQVILNFDAEISTQRESWNTKYLIDTQSTQLPEYHAVHLNILFGYSHQLTLLLYRPVLLRSEDSVQYTEEQLTSSLNKCIDSARALLGIHRMLHQDGLFKPYCWYNQGLGSFHAFHGAVVIAYACMTRHHLSIETIAELQGELKFALTVFNEIAASGLSRVCSKAVPTLEKLVIAVGLSSRAGPATTPLQAIDHNHYDTASDSTYGSGFQAAADVYISQQQMDAFLETLEPQQWLSPSLVGWDDMDSILTATSR